MLQFLLLLQEQQPQNISQLLIIALGLVSIAGTFATVVAMFVSLKGKVENQNAQIAELQKEIEGIKKSLETLIRLEERVDSMRGGRK